MDYEIARLERFDQTTASNMKYVKRFGIDILLIAAIIFGGALLGRRPNPVLAVIGVLAWRRLITLLARNSQLINKEEKKCQRLDRAS